MYHLTYAPAFIQATTSCRSAPSKMTVAMSSHQQKFAIKSVAKDDRDPSNNNVIELLPSEFKILGEKNSEYKKREVEIPPYEAAFYANGCLKFERIVQKEIVRNFLDNGVLSSEVIVAWYAEGPPDPSVFKTKRRTTSVDDKNNGPFQLVFAAFWAAVGADLWKAVFKSLGGK